MKSLTPQTTMADSRYPFFLSLLCNKLAFKKRLCPQTPHPSDLSWTKWRRLCWRPGL